MEAQKIAKSFKKGQKEERGWVKAKEGCGAKC